MGKKNKKSKKSKTSTSHVDDDDAFVNPVAQGRTFEDESSDPATADDAVGESSAAAQLLKSETVAAGGASILTEEDASSGSSCCCCSWFGSGSGDIGSHGGTSDGSRSIIKFDPMRLMDAQSVDPQLHDHAGILVSIARPSAEDLKVSKKSLARSMDAAAGADEDEVEECVSSQRAAQLEQELATLHDEIKKRHKWEEGRAVTIERREEMGKLMAEAEKVEAELQKEKRRIAQEERDLLVAASADEALSAGLHSLQGLGKKVAAGGRAARAFGDVAASAPTKNVVTIEEHGPLGVEWHYQGGRPVVAGIHDSGCAAKVGTVRIGMVLAQYRQPQLGVKAKVDYETMKAKASSRAGGEIDRSAVTEYLQVSLEVAGRPLQLVFEKPDETPEGESDRDRRVEEHSLGCKIEDLKYLVPLTSKPLGGAFWKCEKHGTTLCDVDAGSIFGSDDFVNEGMRPGLVLKEIVTADGYTRSMNRDDLTYVQTMKQLQVAKRPFVCVFEPKAVPMEFTFDPDTKDIPKPSSAADLKYARHCSDAEYSIIRLLGLSLREEVMIMSDGGGGWGSLSHNRAKFRCRVSGIVPGGMIDRFNRLHEHAYISPGMTLTSIQSPFVEYTSVEGMQLSKVANLFHRAAPGKGVLHTSQKNGKEEKTMFGGKSITLGFAIPMHMREQKAQPMHSSSEEEAEDEEESSSSEDEV